MNLNLMQQLNKDGKSANPTVQTPVFVGSKAAEVASKTCDCKGKQSCKKCTSKQKKSMLKTIIKKGK